MFEYNPTEAELAIAQDQIDTLKCKLEKKQREYELLKQHYKFLQRQYEKQYKILVDIGLKRWH